MESSFSGPIFTHKLESPNFQIEHQINWKGHTYSCGIQSKIHSKSERQPPSNFWEIQLSKQLLSMAKISCAKEQPSRCLLHTNLMMLNNAVQWLLLGTAGQF